METTFIDARGQTIAFDLDDVVDVINGWSARKAGWQSLIIYLPSHKKFVELASALPDIRGNSPNEAFEVGHDYVESNFSLTVNQIAQIVQSPSDWKFVQARGGSGSGVEQ